MRRERSGMKTRIVSPRVPEPPPGTFSNAFRAGNTIYIAGQTAGMPDGSIIGDGDLRAQTAEVFTRIEALLTAADATMDDVVKLTVYLTDIAARAPFSEVRRTFFCGDFPASTLVEVSALAQPGLVVEVEAIAVVSPVGRA